MKLEKFIQKNNLNLYKYTSKGYCVANQNNVMHLVYFIEDFAKNKTALHFVIENENVIYMNFIRLKKFEIPVITYNNEQITFTSFYRPVGILQTQFELIFPTTTSGTKVISNFFDMEESLDKTNISINIKENDRYIYIKKDDFVKTFNIKCWLPNKMIVHNGKMHADDILAAGLAKYINPNIQIIRTRDIPEDFDGIIADVGDGRYDHHQEHKYRVNKTTGLTSEDQFGNIETYAAFGLLAKDILPGLIGEKGYYTIDHQFISALDNSDNYGTFNDVSYLFELFNPAWNSDETSDSAFNEASNIAKIFIGKIIEKELARAAATPFVQNALKEMKNDVLVLDKRAPWQGFAKKSTALLCVYPTDTGWAIQTVQENNADARENSTKISLPKEWLELEDDELVFCHQELFFAVFKTKQKAIDMANSVVNAIK